MTAVASGQGPDVLNIGNTWSATLQDTGALLAFGEEELKAIGGEGRFLPAAMRATGASGEPPASIPYLGQAFGLYYNTELFAAAGIERPPATWTELLADARILTRPGQWGISLPAGGIVGNAQLAFVLGRQQGAELFGEDGSATFDTPALRRAVRSLIDLMSEGVIAPDDAENNGITDSLAALADGRAAMVPHQSSGRGYLASIGFRHYAVAPLPLPDAPPAGGADVQSFVGGTNLAVLADTVHRDEALDLVEFLTSTPEQVVFNKAFGTLPVVTDAYDDQAFADPATAMFGRILRDHAETMPMVPQEGAMEQALGAAVRGLWGKAATGRVTDADIAGALRHAEQQMR
jgi:multiple sugar transport system substrate-binding protein